MPIVRAPKTIILNQMPTPANSFAGLMPVRNVELRFTINGTEAFAFGGKRMTVPGVALYEANVSGSSVTSISFRSLQMWTNGPFVSWAFGGSGAVVKVGNEVTSIGIPPNNELRSGNIAILPSMAFHNASADPIRGVELDLVLCNAAWLDQLRTMYNILNEGPEHLWPTAAELMEAYGRAYIGRVSRIPISVVWHEAMAAGTAVFQGGISYLITNVNGPYCNPDALLFNGTLDGLQATIRLTRFGFTSTDILMES